MIVTVITNNDNTTTIGMNTEDAYLKLKVKVYTPVQYKGYKQFD